MHYPAFIEDAITLPDFYQVQMHYPRTPVLDIETSIHKEITRVFPQSGIEKGDTVAVAVGSRGISQLPRMVKTVCDAIRERGAKPSIVPAMGSHGGAQGAGQVKVLESLGVTEKHCGAPIVSSMDAKPVATIFDDVPVYYSEDILSMDHAVCINRIKPHTKFKGLVESGIYKMLCIGMGKHLGAISMHEAALRHGFFTTIKAAGDALVKTSNLRFALGVVENQYEEPAEICAMGVGDMFDVETKMLERAKKLFPSLPFKQLDALIIGEIGKNISGSGMDPNVTGRAYDLMENDFSGILKATRIALLDLSDQSGGNAIGMGNADFITEKLYRKVDYEKTLINAMTSMSLRKAFIPVRMRHDRMAIQAALKTCGKKDVDDMRVVLIKNTREISTFWVSSALKNEVAELNSFKIMDKVPIEFTEKNDLIWFDQFDIKS